MIETNKVELKFWVIFLSSQGNPCHWPKCEFVTQLIEFKFWVFIEFRKQRFILQYLFAS